MKSINKRVVLFLFSFVMVLSCFSVVETKAKENAKSRTLQLYSESENRLSTDTIVKRESYTTKKKSESGYKRYAYKLYVVTNGQKRLIAGDTRYSFISDGVDIYYISIDAYIKNKNIDNLYKTSVYKYNIATGKKKKIMTATGLDFSNCAKDRYIYLRYQKKSFIWDQYGLYVLNLKNGKFKKIGNERQECVKVYKDKLIVFTGGGDICYSEKIYTYNLNGSGKKIIVKGAFLGCKNNKIYYIQANKKRKIKGFSCDMSGKRKKALTKWVSESKFPWGRFKF